VDGQSTFGHIKNFDLWFPYINHLKVNYFLFYIGINDVYRMRNDRYDNIFFSIPSEYSRLENIAEKSALYLLYETLTGIYIAQKYNADHSKVDFSSVNWAATNLSRQEKEEIQGSLKDLDKYGRRLEILIRKVKSLRSIPVFITQIGRRHKKVNGIIYTPENDNYYYMLECYNNKLLEVCKNQDVLVINLAQDIIWSDSDFYDWTHNTPSGAEKIGRYLYRKLKDVGD